MKKNKIFIILFLLLGFHLSASAQTETLKVMQYNLLNYGNNTSYCTQSNNNINDKNGYIRTILTAYYPDVLTVCEMGKSNSLPTDFLNNNLNINGVSYWKTSEGANTSNSYLTNCIFYNSDKLILDTHNVAQTYVRDVDVYVFRVKSDPTGNTSIVFVIAHLKAGYGSDNENQRATMALNTMHYLNMYYQNQNVLIMGDFNLYTWEEPAYQTFTSSSNYPNAYFIDALYPYGVGEWNNSPYYKQYHTQSTHSDNNGCASSGGMDDRFDFILMSKNIYNGNEGVHYKGGSYNALGQDGNHFNQSINDYGNSAVSQEVADALYNNSDHLPVTLELEVGSNLAVNELCSNKLNYDLFPNPANDKVYLRFYQNNLGKANLLLFNTLGQVVYFNEVFVNDNLSEHVIPVDNLQKGFYFLKITNADGISETVKVVVE